MIETVNILLENSETLRGVFALFLYIAMIFGWLFFVEMILKILTQIYGRLSRSFKQTMRHFHYKKLAKRRKAQWEAIVTPFNTRIGEAVIFKHPDESEYIGIVTFMGQNTLFVRFQRDDNKEVMRRISWSDVTRNAKQPYTLA